VKEREERNSREFKVRMLKKKYMDEERYDVTMEELQRL
jgi:hypothetical protein